MKHEEDRGEHRENEEGKRIEGEGKEWREESSGERKGIQGRYYQCVVPSEAPRSLQAEPFSDNSNVPGFTTSLSVTRASKNPRSLQAELFSDSSDQFLVLHHKGSHSFFPHEGLFRLGTFGTFCTYSFPF